MDGFFRAVIEDAEPIVPAEDGLLMTELLNAIALSAASGRTVRLPLDISGLESLR